MSQFSLNIFFKFEITGVVTSQFPPLMVCAVTFINFLQLRAEATANWDITQNVGTYFYLLITSFAFYSFTYMK